jgi:uncharacterized protein (TIGR02246 family)
MPTTATSSKDDAEIRERLDAWIQALRAKDLDALMALYAPNVVAFDLMPPHQVRGAIRYRENFEKWFEAMPGQIDYEIYDLRIVQGHDVALCYSLGHVKATRVNGETADYWVRVSAGLQKRDGEWLMVHDHVSMPFDVDTTKAVRTLQR